MGLRFDGIGRVTFPTNNIVLDSSVGWTVVTKVKFQGNAGTAKERLWELQTGGALTNQMVLFIGNDTAGESWLRNAVAVSARFNSGTDNGVETSALSFTSADYGVYFIRKVGTTLEVGRCMPAGSVQKASKTNVQPGNLSFLTPLTLGASTNNLKDGREMKEWGVIGRLLTDAEIQQYANDTATFSSLAGANQVMYAPLSEGAGTTTVMQSTAGNQTGTISGGLTWISAGGTAPAGTVTIGTITPSSTGASVPFTYSAADQTGFEYRLNGGAAVTGTNSPQVLTGLTPSTAYTIEIRAINASGEGAWSASAPFTTSAAGSPPAGTFTVGTITTTQTTASVPYTYSASDFDSIQYRINGGTPVTASASPQSLTGLTAGTTYGIEFRAVNAFGSGAWSTSAPFTTAAVPVGTITLIDLADNTTTLWSNLSGIDCIVMNESATSIVVAKTGLTSDADGDVTFNDAAITAGTWYTVVIVSGTNRGVIRIQAT